MFNRRSFVLGLAASLGPSIARAEALGRPVWCWGDSLTNGTPEGAPNYPIVLQQLYAGTSAPRLVDNEGRGGETSSQIVARFFAQPSDSYGDESTHVFWMGRNDFPDSTLLADNAQRVADWFTKGPQFSHGRVLFLTTLNTAEERQGSFGYDVIAAMNHSLIARLGERVLDIRSLLVKASNGKGDAIASDWTIDGLHLNAPANAHVADIIKSEIDRRGW